MSYIPHWDIVSNITLCQEKEIKVKLSMGHGAGGCTLASTADASILRLTSGTTFWVGNPCRPHGAAVFDGIDFDIEGGKSQHWDELTQFLSAYSKRGKKVYMTAALQCPFPDAWVSGALKTGLFDYVWVQFYNNPPCQYTVGDLSGLESAWKTAIPTTKIFLGLPAAGSGFIPAADLITKVLPAIKGYEKYGGSMLWFKYYDDQDDYSSSIKTHV